MNEQAPEEKNSVKNILAGIAQKHRSLWSRRRYTITMAAGLLVLLASFFINYQANLYTTRVASNHVSDLLLDNLPVVNVDFFFFEGMTAFWIFVIILLFIKPERAPFTIECIILFILIRAGFITLTHLGLPPEHSYIEPSNFFRYITLGNDMFFSSHAGMPFLLSMVFWDMKKLRYLFIVSSIFFAGVVLLGHLHYSIDVFGAYFITYTIFAITRYLFPRDYRLCATDKLQ